MFEYKYLTEEHLKGLDTYKYSAVDTSPISKYLMHPFWNNIVKIVPAWISPNVLTMAGFICVVANLLILLVYDYYYGIMRRPGEASEDIIPSYVYIICSILLVLAYNLDGIDGKHARTLGVSGPLGELFDHGVDSYVVFLIPFSCLFCFGRNEYSPSPFRAFTTVISVTLNSYITHVEKYLTGTLFLPWGYDFSMWASSFIILAPAIKNDIFKRYIFWNVTPFKVLEAVVHSLGLGVTVTGTVYRIWCASKSGTTKIITVNEGLRPVWSMLAMTVLMILWTVMSPNVLEQEFTIFLLLYGTLFSNITTRLIVSSMSNQPCDVISWLNWPLLISIVICSYQPTAEISVLYALSIVCLLCHVHYGVCVVRQICSYYKIPCFTIHNDKTS